MSDSGNNSGSSSGPTPPTHAPVATYETHFGANQQHVVVRTSAPLEVPAKGKKAYIASNVVQKPPRSYSADREAQQMRHVATALMTDPDVAKGQEVQITRVDTPENSDEQSFPRYLISTNTNAGNRRLKEIFSGDKSVREGVMDLIRGGSAVHARRDAMDEVTPDDSGSESDDERDEANERLSGRRRPREKATEADGKRERVGRHLRKFQKRRNAHQRMAMPPVVPDSVDSTEDGLHAERRNERVCKRRVLTPVSPLPKELNVNVHIVIKRYLIRDEKKTLVLDRCGNHKRLSAEGKLPAPNLLRQRY